MSRGSRVLVLGASVAGALAAGTVAVAQSGSNTAQPASTAEARLAWAKRHVELVCRPLETQKMFDRATRCYNDVARLMGVASSEAPAKVERADAAAAKPAQADRAPAAAATAPAAAAVPAVKPTPAARPAPIRVTARPVPARTAAARPRTQARSVAVAQNEAQSAPTVSTATSRCSGVACLRYTLLGVGF